MHYDSKTDWMAAADRLFHFTLPHPQDGTDEGDADMAFPDEPKLSGGVRLAIILFGAFASWAVLVLIGWAIVSAIRTLLGH
ncbi:hypothetical protein [Sphingomonas pokkalii]|nr:hypothetical protein [Sphingomonas pokkalii]